jgi:hypothetical protein
VPPDFLIRGEATTAAPTPRLRARIIPIRQKGQRRYRASCDTRPKVSPRAEIGLDSASIASDNGARLQQPDAPRPRVAARPDKKAGRMDALRTRQLGTGGAVAGAICALVFAGATRLLPGTSAQEPTKPPGTGYPQPAYQYTEEDYGYGNRLTPEQREGRDTWYFWTAGNEKFWVKMARVTGGNVDLLNYVDSRRNGYRFRDLGAITQPGCTPAKAPDEYGLWLDTCDQPPVPGVPGEASGIVGLRKFKNPAFDPAKWDAVKYYKDPSTTEPPYLIGMACGFCHVGFNPLNPPVDLERPKWSNLAGAIGNQYWEEGKLFNLKMPPTDFRWHVGNRQPPGTSDTSRFATDHANNPNAINAIFNLAFRPTEQEKMRDGSMRAVHHILKDGADSIGVAGASLRVYVNIGMCADYWMTLHDPVYGYTKQKPFDIDYARANCADFRNTEARMGNAESFLKLMGPMKLADAPGGRAYLTDSDQVLARGKTAFADNCARCHSSKQPPADVATDAAKTQTWFRAEVMKPDFLDSNFLSDDRRHPVTEIGTNVARAMATNAMRGHVWEQFSSETYKNLPSAGVVKGLYNPQKPAAPITIELPAGGPGYYRTPSLVAVWTSAPYLHNNALGTFVKDPSVHGRMAAFTDGMERLLWPERRLGVQSIIVTSVDSTLNLLDRRQLKVPAGTPVDLIARVDPTRTPSIVRETFILNLLSDETLFRGFLRNNQAPDFVLDRGHYFGTELPADDKWALIEYLKTF